MGARDVAAAAPGETRPVWRGHGGGKLGSAISVRPCIEAPRVHASTLGNAEENVVK